MSTDWTKPVYVVSNGDEVVALRFPNDGVYFDPTDHVFVVNKRTRYGAWFERDSDKFTNTPPVQDWENLVNSTAPGVPGNFRVRFGRRNGKPFAEVVE